MRPFGLKTGGVALTIDGELRADGPARGGIPQLDVPRNRECTAFRGGDEAPDGDGADLVILFRNPVVLMTEREVDGKFGTGAIATEAEGFATDFTANMEQIGRRYSSIGALLSLYRLLDLMFHVHVIGKVEPPALQFWLREYKSKCKGPPARVPSLRRYCWFREGNSLHELYVAGGVRMPISLRKSAVKLAASHGLKERIATTGPEPAASTPK